MQKSREQSDLLEAGDVPEDRLKTVRRNLDEVAYGLEQLHEEKTVFGGLNFQIDDLKEVREYIQSRKVSKTLSYLADNTEYLEKTHNGYRIDLEDISDLLEEVEKVDTIPTVQEEEEMMAEVVEELEEEGIETTYQNIKERFTGRLPHKTTYHALKNRIGRHPDLEVEEKDGKHIYSLK